MKVSLNLVKQFTDIDLPIDKLVEKIGAQLGAVEHVESLSERYQGILIAKVVDCVKHPSADKLSVCMIDVGKPKNVQVVCGAPNVRAGQLVVWIPPGVTVPSTVGKDPLVLEVREIRGKLSNGMLASAKELALGDSHEGIVVVDEKARPGQYFAKVYELDDYVIDIENKMLTHRPDCFGVLGVAREIAGIEGKPFKSPVWCKEDAKLPGTQSNLSLTVENELPKLVPRFSALPISGVVVEPSNFKLQSYLARHGIKPINSIVDITNYVMLVTGQPLHAYDADKLATGKLGVRLSEAGENLKLIGDKSLKLKAGSILITDGQKPIGLGGVMGGTDTQVDEQTKNIILEAATFDMNLTRKTAMAYDLFTDAATRFTKNQSPRQTLPALAEAAKLIKQFAGGAPGKLSDIKDLPKPPAPIDVPAKFINERLGLNLGAIEIKRLLDNVEFKVRRDAGKLAITPPFWRTDIEIPEDIVEEIGRLHGYDHLPQTLPLRSIWPTQVDPKLVFKTRLRQLLTQAGANEVLTYSFVHGSLLEKTQQPIEQSYHIRNALSPDLQYYRQSLTPSLLEKVHPNIKAGFGEFALFEIGKGHVKGLLNDEKLPAELEQVALVFASKNKASGAPYFEAKKFSEYLLHELGIHGGIYEPLGTTKGPSYYEPARTAVIKIADKTVGFIGEFKLSVSQQLKLPPSCAGFGLGLAELMPHVGPNRYQSLNRFPELEQDLCLRTSTDVSYSRLSGFLDKELAKTSAQHGYKYQLKPLDIFQKPSDKNHKQTTWRISLEHPERTLTNPEVNKVMDDLATAAKLKYKAERI